MSQERWPVCDAASESYGIYSRANVGEIFPDPITPLNASAGFQVHLEAGWRDAFVNCGVWDHSLYTGEPDRVIIPAFGSYLYINMSLMRLFGIRVPGFSVEAVDLQYFGDMPGIPSYESEQRPGDEDEDFAAQAGAWLMGNVMGTADLALHDADRTMVEQIQASRPDLSTLTDEELRARLVAFGPPLQRMFANHIEASLKCGVGLGAVAQIAAAVGMPELSLTLVQGIGDVDSTGPSTALWNLSRRAAASPSVAALFDSGIDGLLDRVAASEDPAVMAFGADVADFLAEWGFRGPGEWEISVDTWGTRPELALAIVDKLRKVSDDQDPETKQLRLADERETAQDKVRGALAGNDEVLAQFEGALHAAALWLRGRERQRTTGAMLMHELRLPALELGRRLVERGALDDGRQLFMLFADELDAFAADPASMIDELRSRHQTYLDLARYEPPFVTVGAAPDYTQWPLRGSDKVEVAAAGDTIQGIPGCGGVAQGRARVVLSPDEDVQFEPGEVLVAPITDPSWTPLFMTAAAVIVEVGAPFSHAAIVSRELGIPCVVSASDVTRSIPTGALIEVDGTSGTVRIIEV